MSNLGKKDRQIWYEFHSKYPRKPVSPQDRIKFLFGDILEHLLIFFAKEAGHSVREEQKKVEVDGVRGKQDAIIDDVVVDAKSCSSNSFKKFQKGDLKDDPFGYKGQLAGYSEGNNGMDGAFLAIDKQHGEITLLPIGSQELQEYKVRDRIAHLKEVIKSEEPPPRCYEPVPFGESGNEKLSVGCSFCQFRKECWPEVRTFLYSNGPVHLVTIKREPKVPEIFKD